MAGAMEKSYTQRIGSKWVKTRVLLRSKRLRRYVPQTRKLNAKNLHSMLKRYGMVYIKPNHGTSGKGVAKLSRFSQNGRTLYRCRWGTRKREFASFGAMYRMIRNRTSHRPYLVQKGIRVLRHGKLPFDFRVMVQISPRGRWETTGIIGRIAAPHKVITNRSGGGAIMKAGPLLARHVPKRRRIRLICKLSKLGVQTAVHMKKTFRGIKELGLDVAVDRKLKPWILEVNSTPVVKLFYQLRDKRMIRKMIRYGRAYGRKFRNLRKRGRV
jgi:hypothetical protein